MSTTPCKSKHPPPCETTESHSGARVCAGGLSAPVGLVRILEQQLQSATDEALLDIPSVREQSFHPLGLLQQAEQRDGALFGQVERSHRLVVEGATTEELAGVNILGDARHRDGDDGSVVDRGDCAIADGEGYGG